LLKREALEQAIYSAVELGVNKVQLLITEKVQRNWQVKELERLKHIMIAAAEQSKCFAIPQLLEPVPLLDVPLSGSTVFFDPEGEALADVLIKDLYQKQIDSLTVVIGPEGDLTESEKFYLQKQQALFICLTPTILRAQQAVALGVGILRSFFSIY
jgi:RsmE family RNA methyltransferase